ncbi:MAG TPA: beta-galactosidase [Lachnospiraceae bacterium]|nr:beta-galactosidase [Lachnospiraceae bacterium]
MKTTEFGYNSNYMLKDQEPWFPVMGEIHYSRYPKQYWRESLYKMKAGGVEVVSSYVIWIHHEEIEKEYDFTGNKDLREFITACKDCGLSLVLRIGPWSHAEVRNGGFPDWLLRKDYEVRTNDAGYLEEVRRLYTKIYEQAEGLLLKDGGPVIGVQIENEYGHCGGLDGEEGERHMRLLTEMAKEIGFDVPIYTATGWGGAVTGGLLPVMGGYCEAPWDQRLMEIEPSGNYVFTHERNDHNIGSDYGFGTGITFDISKFPYLTAELGGGLQVTHHRRPVAYSTDIGAMSMVKLGSGVNLLGYYMYHGGTNPEGKLTTLQESKATGSINDLPVLNYDFRAPIREYGQISETFKEIKLLTMFLKDFGSEICEMPAIIPESNPLFPTNFTDLRTSYRYKENKGYIFVNNYQRRYAMENHRHVVLTVPLENETVTYPAIDIADRDYFFYPFNMNLGNAVLKTALATPLCKLSNSNSTYVFYTDKDPSYCIEGELNGTKLLTLTREEAKNAWKVKLDQEYLIVSDSSVIEEKDTITIFGRRKPILKVFPAFTSIPEGFVVTRTEGDFTVYEKAVDSIEATAGCTLIAESDSVKRYEIKVDLSSKPADAFVRINYQGDSAKIYKDGVCIADHFYTGKVWEIGLRQFDFPGKLEMEVFPLKENEAVFLESWPEMKDGIACELTNVAIDIEYHNVIGRN